MGGHVGLHRNLSNIDTSFVFPLGDKKRVPDSTFSLKVIIVFKFYNSVCTKSLVRKGSYDITLRLT